jgi:rod shape-determining protein MreC
MRNLFYFITRFNALLLFIILEIVCIYWVATQNSRQREIFIKTSQSLSGWIVSQQATFQGFFTAPYENELLMEQNARLKTVVDSLQNIILVQAMQEDTSMIASSRFTYLPANVISSTTHLLNNHLTLNRGTKAGAIAHSGVISETGPVGIIIHASEHYSLVMSLLHRSIRLSAELKGTSFHGSLVWRGNDYTSMTLEAIPKHAPVKVGDPIVTSGFSGMFPPGLLIGHVDEIILDPGSNFFTLQIALATDLNNLRNVYILGNKFRDEWDKIQEVAGND